jgi:tetratricopeptide (TPR) repeat protein
MAVKREQVVQTAEKYVARGKIEPAIREYRKLLEENPNDINTLNRVGDLYARIQRIEEAVDFFNQIAEQYAGEGFFVKAIAIYKKIIKLDPTRLDVYENLAELYHRQGLVTEARTQYQVLADYYQKHDNATSTIAIYQKMAELEPNNPTYHVKLAELYQQQQLIEKAMGEYRIIAELMLAHGHPQEAAQVYERALAIDSTNLAFITDAALKLKEAAGTGIAVRFLSAAVERNPQAVQVARMIGGTAGLGGTHAGIAMPAAPSAPPSAPPGLEPPPALAAAPAAPQASPPAPLSPPAGSGYAAAAPPSDLELEQELEIEIDLGADLVLDEVSGAPPAAAAAPAPAGEEGPDSRFGLAAGFEPAFEVEEDLAGAAGPAPAQAAPGPEPGDADLDDVFVLDIEDEEEPASLVKPPPDMLREPRRPPWAQESTPPPQGALPLHGAEPPPPAGLAPHSPVGAPPELRLTGEFELINPFAALVAPDVVEPSRLPSRPYQPLAGAPPTAEALSAAPPSALGAPASEIGEVLPPLPPLAPQAPIPADVAWPAGAPGAATPEVPAGGALSGEAPDAAAVEPPAIKIDSDLLERTAAELHPPTVERYEDLVSEAEVLAKYGLEEKAIERLRDAVRIKPRQFAAYLLLIQLQLDKGRHARVIELANQVSRLSEAGDREPWAKLRRRLLAAGFRLDGDRVAAAPQLPGAADREGAARSARPRVAPTLSEAPGAVADRQPGAAAGPPAAEAASPPAAAAGEQPAPSAAAPPSGAPAARRRPRKPSDTGIEKLLQDLVDRPARAGRAAKKAAPATPPAEPAGTPATEPPVEPVGLHPAGVPAKPGAPPVQVPAEPAAGPPSAAPAELAAAPPSTAPAGLAGLAGLEPSELPGELPPELEAELPAGLPTELPAAAAPPPAPLQVPPAAAASPAPPPASAAVPVSAEASPPAAAAAPPADAEGHELVELPPLLEVGDEDEAALPAEVPPPVEIFNPLEIGAMVENEEIDWSDEAAGGPPPSAPLPSAPLPPSLAAPAAAAASTSGGALGLDDTGGMSWLDEADRGKDKAAARAASLFDEEEDFFDLAGELAQELSKEPVFQGEDLLVQQEQSLEEIVEGFKRGVAEHLSPTDYDTHFNLGIAYREMELLDEAIGEFQLSAKDARYLVSCCSMLGLCFLDKGLPELAIKWYRRGLEAEGITEEDTLGLLYDMGCAYLAMGDNSGAYKTFVDAYGINTNYRDLVARIEELGRPH